MTGFFSLRVEFLACGVKMFYEILLTDHQQCFSEVGIDLDSHNSERLSIGIR